MKKDAFKPQGKELTVVQGVQPPGAELGRHVRAQAQPTQMSPAPMSVKQGGNDRFVAASGPVAMAGTQPPAAAPPAAAPAQAARPVPSAGQGRGFQPAPPEQSVQHQLGAQRAAAEQAQQAQQAQLAANGLETFHVYIDGTGPDGSPLTTDPIPVQFPAGSSLSGLRYERA